MRGLLMKPGLYATLMKTCSKCGQEKDIEFFFKHTGTSDGHHSWCKACCSIGNKLSRAKAYSTIEGRAYYNSKTGSNLKAPQPEGGSRKKSFCARMGGVKGPMKDENGKPTRKALALKKWKC